MFLRKWFLPWTAADLFETDELFLQWLKKRQHLFDHLRALFLVAAAACLIVGYIIDSRPIMLLTIVPLALVLPLTTALERINTLFDGQNKPES